MVKYALLLILTFICVIVFISSLSDLNYKHLSEINKNKTNFCFAVVGDSRDNPEVFDKIINSINRDENVSFTIILGDFVNNGNPVNFLWFIFHSSKFKKPWLTVVGNHELLFGSKFFYESFFGKSYYAFSSGKSYFIILDVSKEKEGMDSKQKQWLINELNKSSEFKHRFVFFHIPLHDPRFGNETQGHSLKNREDIEYLLHAFKMYNVSFIFTSHIHGYFNGSWNGIPYVITGGGGAPLHGEGNNYFYHWIKFCIDKEKTYFDVIKIQS